MKRQETVEWTYFDNKRHFWIIYCFSTGDLTMITCKMTLWSSAKKHSVAQMETRWKKKYQKQRNLYKQNGTENTNCITAFEIST